MGQATEISWTDHTFNPWWGCVKVSPACDHCYAETFARRVGFSETGSQFPIWGKDSGRRLFGDAHWFEPIKWDRDAAKAGVRRRVFCGSMCDVMEDHGTGGTLLQSQRERLYDLIEITPNLDWLLLTKRPQNFRRFLPKVWLSGPRPNVWGMTTVESPEYLWRATDLVNTPFAVRGLSIEPLLGPLSLRWAQWEDLKGYPHKNNHLDGLRRLSWVIVGGESGPGARPMNPAWVRSLRDECVDAGVAFHLKQWGNWIPCEVRGDIWEHMNGPYPKHIGASHEWGDGFGSVHVADKKAAGRLLDGREWNELPAASTPKEGQ